MPRSKKIDYKKLSVEEFCLTFSTKISEIEEMLRVAESINLNVKKAAPTLSNLGMMVQNPFNSYSAAPNVDQSLSSYVRPQTPALNPQLNNNPNVIEDLDLIVTPLDPTAPSGETYRGNAVAPLADQGIPVTIPKASSPVSQLEAIENSINSRLLELDSLEEGLDGSI